MVTVLAVDKLKYCYFILQVTARNNAGNSSGTSITVQTAEDVPGMVQNLNATYDLASYSISVTWNPPANPNGVITQYT